MSVVSPRDLLLQYQDEYSRDEARFKAWLAARQIGKDFTGNEEIVRDCMTVPKNMWMIAAPSERQSLESLEKAKEWTEAYQLAIDDYQEERDGPGALIKSATITYSNKSRVIAVPGRPDTVRGYSTNVFMTEFAFFDDPAATWKAILPSITNPLRGGLKKVRIASTANGKSGQGGKFFEIFDKNFFNPQPGRKQSWSCHVTDIHTAVRQGLPIDIEEIREAMDDAEGFAQEYECEFLDGSNVLLPYDLIALAESSDATEFAPADFWNQSHANPIYLGIDFGRQHDPTVCYALERIGDILWTREVLMLRNMSSVEQENILRSRIRAAQRVCFDYTGVGIGMGDHLVEEYAEYKPDDHKLTGKIELCTFTLGFKREIFPKFRRQFEAPTKIRVPISVEVREDFHAMQQIIRNGEYNYSAPRTAEGHSDRCTAGALAVRASGTGGNFAFQSLPLKRGRTRDARFNRRSIS